MKVIQKTCRYLGKDPVFTLEFEYRLGHEFWKTTIPIDVETFERINVGDKISIFVSKS